MSPWYRLRAAIVEAILDHHAALELPMVFECDHEESNATFSRLAGLRAARAALLAAVEAKRPLPAVLIVGISAEREVANVNLSAARTDGGLAALLEWPGAAYMQYGFTRDDLSAAAARIIDGAKAPLPSCLHVARTDLLRATSNVRHWLEGRLRNERGALKDFYAAARGEIELVQEHVEPRVSVSKEHQEMLDRLFGLSAAARRYAPSTSGLDDIRHAIDTFETAWRSLEDIRSLYLAQLTKADPAARMRLATQVCSALEQVTDSLSLAIAETKRFDEQIQTGVRGNDER